MWVLFFAAALISEVLIIDWLFNKVTRWWNYRTIKKNRRKLSWWRINRTKYHAENSTT